MSQNMKEFADRLNLAFRTITQDDGSEYAPEDIQAATNKAITASYIWRLRSGKADNPTIKVVKLLSDFFGVQPSFFLDDFKQDDAADSLQNQVLMRSAGLTTADQQILLEMAKQIKRVRAEYEQKEKEDRDNSAE